MLVDSDGGQYAKCVLRITPLRQNHSLYYVRVHSNLEHMLTTSALLARVYDMKSIRGIIIEIHPDQLPRTSCRSGHHHIHDKFDVKRDVYLQWNGDDGSCCSEGLCRVEF